MPVIKQMEKMSSFNATSFQDMLYALPQQYRDAYRYMIQSRNRCHTLRVWGIEMMHSKRYSYQSKNMILLTIKDQYILIKWGHFGGVHCQNKPPGGHHFGTIAHLYCAGNSIRWCAVLLIAGLCFWAKNSFRLSKYGSMCIVIWIDLISASKCVGNGIDIEKNVMLCISTAVRSTFLYNHQKEHGISIHFMIANTNIISNIRGQKHAFLLYSMHMLPMLLMATLSTGLSTSYPIRLTPSGSNLFQ